MIVIVIVLYQLSELSSLDKWSSPGSSFNKQEINIFLLTIDLEGCSLQVSVPAIVEAQQLVHSL